METQVIDDPKSGASLTVGWSRRADRLAWFRLRRGDHPAQNRYLERTMREFLGLSPLEGIPKLLENHGNDDD